MQRALAGVVLATLVFISSCSDGSTNPGPEIVIQPLPSIVCAANADWVALKAESDSVLTAGSLNGMTVRTKLDNLERLCAATNSGAAKQQAVDIVHFVVAKYEQGALTPVVPPGSTPERETVDFVNHVLAAAVINVAYTQLANSWIVNPADPTQTFVTIDGLASITVSGEDVDSTTLITAETLPPAPNYLETDLDQYARYYRFTKTTAGGNEFFNNPVAISICVLTPASLPDEVFERLRVGAQHASGFEVTSPTSSSSFDCSEAAIRRRASGSGAAPMIIGDDGSGMVERGSVGGLADNFSDFGVIDPEISARGSVGGLADNFRPRPGTTLANESTTCVSLSAESGEQVPVDCRPTMTFRTVTGQTPLDGIPVTFTVLSGGGLVAVEQADQSCGPFSSSVTATSASGTGAARICWILGSAGANTVGAQASNGGDAIDGTYFVYSSGEQDGPGPNGIVFTATALPKNTTASVTGGVFTYDGQAHPGSATCTPSSLSPVLTYAPGGAMLPVEAGTYTVTATCGDGQAFTTSTATAVLTVTKAPSSTAVSCPNALPYAGSPLAPCSATVTGAGGFSATVPVTYTNNEQAGVATAHAVFPGGTNHQASEGTAAFTIEPAASTVVISCVTATYTGAPATPCTAAAVGASGLNVPIETISYDNNVGAGTATASATFAGTASVAGSSGSATFSIEKAPTSTTITCGAATYTGLPITTACSAAAIGAGGLNVPVTTIQYSNNIAAGHASALASYAGGPNHLPSARQTTFFIAPLPLTATTGSATIEFGTAVPVLPCTLTGLLPADALSVTCQGFAAYTVAGAYQVAPKVSPTPNYTVTAVPGTLTVHPYTKVNCFENPVAGTSPATSSTVAAGAAVVVVCSLQNSVGIPQTNGHGNIEVRAAGPSPAPGADPAAFPVVFAATDVFVASPSGEHVYYLDTSGTGFAAGTYYHVTVRWNDGSSTTGWFHLN